MKKKVLVFTLAILAALLLACCAQGEGIPLGKSGWVELDSGKYYGDPQGNAITGQWILDKEYYFFNAEGLLQTGWIKLENKWWNRFADDYSYTYQTSSSRIKEGWRYADEQGKVLMSLEGLKSLKIPAEVDGLPDGFFAGVTREFVIECEAGSYAEQLAKKLGLPYDNGNKRVLGTSISDVSQKVDWVVDNYISSGMSDREKALALHNWLIYNAHYDYTLSNHAADGVLVKGTGVCDSYSRAYGLLLTKVGIENKRATGGNHAWNVVRIGGQWYFVDTTWDDPNDSGEASVSGYERSTYFLVNDSTIRKDHTFEQEIWADSNNVGWVEMGPETYYYGQDGKRATGMTDITTDGIVFDQETQAWINAPVTRRYCFSTDGVMLTGWQNVDGNVYYFGDNGVMCTGFCYIGEDYAKYYLGDDGVLRLGWLSLIEEEQQYNYETQKTEPVEKEHVYYLDPEQGGKAAKGWAQIDGDWYYFDSDCYRMTGWITLEGGSRYYLGTDGKRVTGLVKVPDQETYYNWETGQWETIAVENPYLFDQDGKKIGNGPVKINLTLPAALKRIESEAFANLEYIALIHISESVEYIADDAFSGSTVIIATPAGSQAEKWAKDHGITVIYE